MFTAKTLSITLITITLFSACVGESGQNLKTPRATEPIVIDGHTLPPEPDKTLNNSTLLGIDVNDNGVRDDVERWIYLEMEIQNGYPKIERAIGMQMAEAAQMTLSDPSNKDDDVHKEITASRDCWTYYIYSKDIHSNATRGKFSRALKDKIFNNQKRLSIYLKYDATLGGRVFTKTPTLQTKSRCITDIDEL